MRKYLTKYSRIIKRGAQQFFFVLIFEKGKLTGLTEQDKKGDFAVLTRTCRAECYLHHPGTMPRITGVYLLNQRSPYSLC